MKNKSIKQTKMMQKHEQKMARINQKPLQRSQKYDYKVKKAELRTTGKVNAVKAKKNSVNATIREGFRSAGTVGTVAFAPVSASWNDAVMAEGKGENQENTLGGNGNSGNNDGGNPRA